MDEGEDWKSVEVPADCGPPPAATEAAPAPASASSAPAPTVAHPSTSIGSDRLIGPAVKNYLRKYGLEATSVAPSGPHGTVTKGDVLQHVLANKIEPVAIGMTWLDRLVLTDNHLI